MLLETPQGQARALGLLAPADVAQMQRDVAVLSEIMDWVQNFLARPHKDLGRSGPVCPFIPLALRSSTIWFAILHTELPSVAEVEAVVRELRDRFLQLEPRTGEAALLKTIMLILPDVPDAEAPALIDGVQRRLKPFFLAEGLMIGEFHRTNESPGLHNPAFRPLRTPIPSLAIRHLVDSDLPFLMREFDPPAMRVQFLETYLARMSDKLAEPQLRTTMAALHQARAELQTEEGEPDASGS